MSGGPTARGAMPEPACACPMALPLWLMLGVVGLFWCVLIWGMYGSPTARLERQVREAILRDELRRLRDRDRPDA